MAKITLEHITKIEGHAKLELGIHKGKVTTCKLSATEGARYFEGLVKGRQYNEAHEMTSRICGICSCAHVIAALHAVEDAMGIKVSKQTHQLRILLTLGERIRSHATHLYFLTLPDYLGYESALAMASKYRKEVERALRIMRVGNSVIKLLAARDLHPVSATVGGWLKLPKQHQLTLMRKELIQIKQDAEATMNLFLKLAYPAFTSNGDWYSLKKEGEYAVLDGIFSSDKNHFDKNHYRKFIDEHHESRSTANFVVKDGHRYMVGAIPRLNNNHQNLSKDALKFLSATNITFPSTNPYYNVLGQAIEIIDAVDQAIAVCTQLKIHDDPPVKPVFQNATGVGMIEVPRGTLWHEYSINEEGIITGANIITPTAQNLLNMQEDIREFVPTIGDHSKEDIILDVEKLIRSYDPCFSCSAHFLEVEWQ